MVTKSASVAESWDNDPLRHDWLAPSLGTELIEFEEKIIKDAIKITTPLLVVHGTEDRVSNLASSLDLISRCGSIDQTHVTFSSAWYGTLSLLSFRVASYSSQSVICAPDMENDIEAGVLATYISTWVKARWPTPNTAVRAKVTMPAVPSDIAVEVNRPPSTSSSAAASGPGPAGRANWTSVRPSMIIKNSKTELSPGSPSSSSKSDESSSSSSPSSSASSSAESSGIQTQMTPAELAAAIGVRPSFLIPPKDAPPAPPSQ